MVHSQFDVRSPYVSQPLLLVFSVLLDHSVRSRQHIRRNRQADLLGRLEIDHELEFRGLFDRNVGWLGAFQNLVNVKWQCGGNGRYSWGHRTLNPQHPQPPGHRTSLAVGS